MPKYAVVKWYNYRKELNAGFLKGFDDLEEARIHAYKLALRDMDNYGVEGAKIITEDEITDGNGPGKYGSPYYPLTIVGYGGRYPDGYSSNFFCVVPWFEGVMNSWDVFESDAHWNAIYGGEWYPKYSRSFFVCTG